MKDVVSILEYHNEKLYDVRHIVGKFKEYYGLNLDEMKELFEEYNVCYWSNMICFLSILLMVKADLM